MKKYYTNVYSEGCSYESSVFGYQTYGKGLREQSFDTYDEAVKAAIKTAAKTREDVTIYVTDSVVHFPVDDYKVEKVV